MNLVYIDLNYYIILSLFITSILRKMSALKNCCWSQNFLLYLSQFQSGTRHFQYLPLNCSHLP